MRLKATAASGTIYCDVPQEDPAAWDAYAVMGPRSASDYLTVEGVGRMGYTRDGRSVGQRIGALTYHWTFTYPHMAAGSVLADIDGGPAKGCSGWNGLVDFWSTCMDEQLGVEIQFDGVQKALEAATYFSGAPLSCGYIHDDLVGPVRFSLVGDSVTGL